ncbi:MAG: large subunit ribosomal protein L24 [Kangiellaceae bacterium]|jgi:large subunit ribosomal protein L24
MARKIRRDDEIVVLAGKDKGKQGKVLRVVVSDDRVYVEGVNIVKKHQKANPQANEPGGIIDKEASIHVSNIALVNPATGKADRVGFRVEDEKKVRFFKSNGDLV